MEFTRIGWESFNEFDQINASKQHLVASRDDAKTLCGKEIPAHAEEFGGIGTCKRCAQIARSKHQG